MTELAPIHVFLVIVHAFCRLLIFPQNITKFLQTKYYVSQCQTVCTLIRLEYLSNLIWVQTVNQGY